MATSWDVICFIGLGNMGSAMVERIVESGVVKKLIVWNRTPEKAEKVGKLGSSVTVAGDMQEVVKLLEAEAGEKKSLHLMLTGDEATAEILEGMFRAGLTDQVVVNHATISQMAAKECGERCRQTGNRYITATVTGRPPAARAGTLAIWLSCDDDKSISDLKQIKADLLPSLARSIQVISETDVTKAITFKLLTNFLLYASAEVFAETTVMFEQNGLDRTLLTSWVDEFASGSIFKQYAERIIARDYDSKGGAGLDIGVKDLKFIKSLVPDCHLPTLDATLTNMSAEAEQSGGKNADWCSLANEVERRNQSS